MNRKNTDNLPSPAEKKKNVMEPVIISGRKIAVSWWGEAWCRNLEQYADFANRIGRGRSYVRAGAVIDLKIELGTVSAKVQGSRRTPYKVQINIQPLSEERCAEIIEKCSDKIENLDALLGGNFPDELKELFTSSKSGLFPKPSEILFSCSCPDWAYMCKHVAAVLYGIGARLDTNPMLFFELRGIDSASFLDTAIEDKIGKMLKNADCVTERVMDISSGNDIFGVDW